MNGTATVTLDVTCAPTELEDLKAELQGKQELLDHMRRQNESGELLRQDLQQERDRQARGGDAEVLILTHQETPYHRPHGAITDSRQLICRWQVTNGSPSYSPRTLHATLLSPELHQLKKGIPLPPPIQDRQQERAYKFPGDEGSCCSPTRFSSPARPFPLGKPAKEVHAPQWDDYQRRYLRPPGEGKMGWQSQLPRFDILHVQ